MGDNSFLCHRGPFIFVVIFGIGLAVAQTALRDVIGKTILSDMLEGRDKISNVLQKIIDGIRDSRILEYYIKRIMTKTKNLGIWMDHSSAHLMEFTTDPITTEIISSKFTHQEKEHSLSKSESLMHNKEQNQQSAYFKRLGEAIRNYEDVIIFGPTNAKSELLNLLRADHNFENIKLEIEQADKMTQNQQHAFVKDYFSRRELR